jgi:hypothetical protein
VIFFDRSVPKSIASALKLVRNDVKWLEDLFDHNTKDTEWLKDVGAWGWLVISRDKKIRTRPGERRALLENNVGAFYLTHTDNGGAPRQGSGLREDPSPPSPDIWPSARAASGGEEDVQLRVRYSAAEPESCDAAADALRGSGPRSGRSALG